jgi:hypothetical protein
MPAELSFRNPGQRKPEFVSAQPEFGHRNLANTPIAGPLLTPTHNQIIEPSQFAETSPTNYLHAIGPPHAQADPSFTGWSPAFQQNMSLPVEYSTGASRQMPPHMVYPSFGSYYSPQDVSQTFAVPELSRPRDYGMGNMYSPPFRTGSLSHPYIAHRRDSGDVKPSM